MITAPAGFRAAGVACGIKPEGADLAIVAAERPVAAAAVFTTNRVQAAPVLVSKQHVADGRLQAMVISSGNANAATGPVGYDDAFTMAKLTAEAVACQPGEVLVASTGVIGVPLPMERVTAGIRSAAEALSSEGSDDAARAIMTTDTVPKQATTELSLDDATARVGGMAKGAGMIAPNMATMLAFFTTDVAIVPELLREALISAVGATLNRITVDGDTSTNDMAAVLASGACGTAPIESRDARFEAFQEALRATAWKLSEALLADAEGASHLAEVRVEGTRSSEDADRIARVVAESPLVKTALHGGDPNWGRVLAAAGRAGVAFDPIEVDVWIGDVHVAAGGCALEYEEADAHAAMLERPAVIRVKLRSGEASGSVWTCDLTHEYVDINAHYRT